MTRTNPNSSTLNFIKNALKKWLHPPPQIKTLDNQHKTNRRQECIKQNDFALSSSKSSLKLATNTEDGNSRITKVDNQSRFSILSYFSSTKLIHLLKWPYAVIFLKTSLNHTRRQMPKKFYPSNYNNWKSSQTQISKKSIVNWIKKLSKFTFHTKN